MKRSIFLLLILVLLAQMICAQESNAPQKLVAQISNETVTGTTVNRLAKLTGAPSKAIIAATTDTDGVLGIVTLGAGRAGIATIQTQGTVGNAFGGGCDFDGATTAGDYVQNSSSTIGKCHDAGATYPTSGQVLGRVLSTHGSAGTYPVLLTPGVKAGAGVASTRAINTTSPITGGGDLSADRTIACATCTTDTNTQTLTNKTLTSPVVNTPTGIVKGDVGLGNVDNTSDASKPVSTAQQTALNLKEATANRDATGGYAGLTLFKINFRNAANTFTSFFTNANSAARTYTFQNRDGTIADDTDLALKANLISPSFTTPTLGAATGTSINFGGTTLSTYIEGTCTLSLKFGGLSVGLTYAVQLCKYTQIGNLVHVDAHLALSAKGSSTGTATVTGLPVAESSTASRYQLVLARISASTFTGQGEGYIDPTTPTVINLGVNNNGVTANLTDANFTNGSSIILSTTYKMN